MPTNSTVCCKKEMPLAVKFHFADKTQKPHFRDLEADCACLGLPPPSLPGDSFCIEDTLTRNDLLIFGVCSHGSYAALWDARMQSFAPNISGLKLQD